MYVIPSKGLYVTTAALPCLWFRYAHTVGVPIYHPSTLQHSRCLEHRISWGAAQGRVSLYKSCKAMYSGEDGDVCVELGYVGKGISVLKVAQPDKSKVGGSPVC